MHSSDIEVLSKELTEVEILDSLKKVVDIILKDEPGQFTQVALKKIFQKKLNDKSNFSNDGVWYELHHMVKKEKILIEKISISSIEKVETGIDLLSFNTKNQIVFSEMKSSISNQTDEALFCQALLSQFGKNSKDISQFANFANQLNRKNLLSKEDINIIMKYIETESFDTSIANNMLTDKVSSDLVTFESLMCTGNIRKSESEFKDALEKINLNKYSRVKQCETKIKDSGKDSACKNCNKLHCVYNIVKKLEEYRVYREKLDNDFNLNKIYSDCIIYIEGWGKNE